MISGNFRAASAYEELRSYPDNADGGGAGRIAVYITLKKIKKFIKKSKNW